MITEPATAFSRVFRGYDPAAVDAYVEALLAKQKLLIDEVQNLRAQRNESGDQLAALRIEVACLKDEVAHLSDTSPTPYAIQHRMTKTCAARSRRFPGCRPRRRPRRSR